MHEEEIVETMTIQEVARLIDWCRANGLSDTDICGCLKYIATGYNSPVQSDDGSEGMTNAQYKGMLLDQLDDWKRIFGLAVEAGNAAIQVEAEKQIARINEKLKF